MPDHPSDAQLIRKSLQEVRLKLIIMLEPENSTTLSVRDRDRLVAAMAMTHSALDYIYDFLNLER